METEKEQPHLSFGLYVHMHTYESAYTQQRTSEHSYTGVWPSGKVLVWHARVCRSPALQK